VSDDPVVIHINPIFAAFEFPTRADARAAFARLQSEPVGGVGVWNFVHLKNPDDPHYVVAVLGEEQDDVNAAAAVLMGSPGCKGNLLLDEDTMNVLMHRRYDPIVEAAQRGERVANWERSYLADGGLKINRYGEEIR
jgi:hypothetical protein